jgi:hypothetical protein
MWMIHYHTPQQRRQHDPPPPPPQHRLRHDARVLGLHHHVVGRNAYSRTKLRDDSKTL